MELSNQHKNILLLLAAPVPYPLKDKDSLKSTDGFYHQSMETDTTFSFMGIKVYSYVKIVHIIFFRKAPVFQSMFDISVLKQWEII